LNVENVERQEVHELSEAEEHGECEELIAGVDAAKSRLVVKRKPDHVNETSNRAERDDHQLTEKNTNIQLKQSARKLCKVYDIGTQQRNER